MARTQIDGKTGAEEDHLVRRRIIEVARKYFFTNGFRGITMDDLAAEMGMSKKTIYACFASKTALLQAVVLNKFQDVEDSFNDIAKDRPREFVNDLQKLLACVQRHSEEIRPPFIRDIQRDAPELFALIEVRRRALIHRHFRKLLDRGRKAGMIRKDIPTALIIEILLGATEAVVNPQKLIELDLTPSTAYSVVLRVLLEGVIVRLLGAQS